jgi:hypothetical protein
MTHRGAALSHPGRPGRTLCAPEREDPSHAAFLLAKGRNVMLLLFTLSLGLSLVAIAGAFVLEPARR